MSVVLIDSGGANIASVLYALQRLDRDAVLTADPDVIVRAPHVILPGVGAARDAMGKLQARELVECIRGLTQPVIGICLGMQLLFSHSEEGDAAMLDIMSGNVRHFKPEEGKTIPHMGWNNVNISGVEAPPSYASPLSEGGGRVGGRNNDLHPLFRGIDDGAFFYFVHSYYAPLGDYTLASCTYGSEVFSASVAQGNFMGCQFHPERSGAAGQQVLKNFLEM